MYAMVCTRPSIAHVVGVLSRYIKKGFSGICIALLAMDCATKEDRDWIEWWIYMAL
jgi:hypothetical protein